MSIAVAKPLQTKFFDAMLDAFCLVARNPWKLGLRVSTIVTRDWAWGLSVCLYSRVLGFVFTDKFLVSFGL